jgi:hypothetical protein
MFSDVIRRLLQKQRVEVAAGEDMILIYFYSSEYFEFDLGYISKLLTIFCFPSDLRT